MNRPKASGHPQTDARGTRQPTELAVMAQTVLAVKRFEGSSPFASTSLSESQRFPWSEAVFHWHLPTKANGDVRTSADLGKPPIQASHVVERGRLECVS